MGKTSDEAVVQIALQLAQTRVALKVLLDEITDYTIRNKLGNENATHGMRLARTVLRDTAPT